MHQQDPRDAIHRSADLFDWAVTFELRRTIQSHISTANQIGQIVASSPDAAVPGSIVVKGPTRIYDCRRRNRNSTEEDAHTLSLTIICGRYQLTIRRSNIRHPHPVSLEYGITSYPLSDPDSIEQALARITTFAA